MTSPKPKRFVIPLQDYERIFRVAYSVLEGMNAKTGRACIFFSMVGAAILHNFYKKRALIAAGAAFYRVDDESATVVAYGHDRDEMHSYAIRAIRHECSHLSA